MNETNTKLRHPAMNRLPEEQLGMEAQSVPMTNEPRATKLGRAIMEIDNLARELERLHSEIVAQDYPTDLEEPPQQFCTAEVLACGPDWIRGRIDNCYKRIEMLREVLL